MMNFRERFELRDYRIKSIDTGRGVYPEFEGYVVCKVVFGDKNKMEIITSSPTRLIIKPTYVFDSSTLIKYELIDGQGVFTYHEELAPIVDGLNWITVKTSDQIQFVLWRNNN